MSEDGSSQRSGAPRRYVTNVVPSSQPTQREPSSEPEVAAADTDSGNSSSSDAESGRDDDLGDIEEELDQSSSTFQRRSEEHRSVRLNRPLNREVEPSITPWSHGSFRLSRK